MDEFEVERDDCLHLEPQNVDWNAVVGQRASRLKTDACCIPIFLIAMIFIAGLVAAQALQPHTNLK